MSVAGEKAAVKAPASTIWTLESAESVGGHRPEVLGTPQVVKLPSGSALRFNGSSDGLVLPVNPLEGLARFTIEVLFKPEAGGLAEQRFLHAQDEPGSRALMEIRLADDAWALDTFMLSVQSQSERTLLDRTRLHPVERWTWVALVYESGKMAHYINGVKELEGEVAATPMAAGKISLGVRQNRVYWFKGAIREVRFHPVALAEEKLQREP